MSQICTMAAQRPYSEKVEENSMAARTSGHSEGSGVSQVLKELADTIGKAMGRSAELSNVVPGLALYQNTTPTAPNPCTYEPSLLIVPQGKKHVDLGKQSYVFGESTFLLTSIDRKSTRLNSSHSQISYAVFCLKKKKNNNENVKR